MKIDYHWKLIDQIATPILILDSFGEIRHLNEHARILLGIDSGAKTINLPFTQFINENDLQLFEQSLAEVFDGESVDDLQILLSQNDGDERSVSLAGKPLIDQDAGDLQSIWTIKTHVDEILKNDEAGDQAKLQNLQWLADQGRNLLSLED